MERRVPGAGERVKGGVLKWNEVPVMPDEWALGPAVQHNVCS